jgi:hypothetical protein
MRRDKEHIRWNAAGIAIRKCTSLVRVRRVSEMEPIRGFHTHRRNSYDDEVRGRSHEDQFLLFSLMKRTETRRWWTESVVASTLLAPKAELTSLTNFTHNGTGPP